MFAKKPDTAHRLCYVFVFCASLLLYLTWPALRAPAFRWTLSAGLTLIHALVALQVCVWLLYLLLDRLWNGRALQLKMALSASLVGSFLFANHINYQVFQTHITIETILLAIKSFVLTSELNAGGFGAFFALLKVAISVPLNMLLLYSFTLLPERLSSIRLSRNAKGALLCLLIAFVSFKKLWAPPHETQAASIRALLPWEANQGSGRSQSLFGNTKAGQFKSTMLSETTERKQFDFLQSRRRALSKRALRAKKRPNILLVSVESLRADAFNRLTMPRMTALAKQCRKNRRCLLPARHYTTGSNTGTGLFGIFHGLPAYYFALAKEKKASSIPVQALHQLGYRSAAYYTKDMRPWDGIHQLLFGSHPTSVWMPKVRRQVDKERRLIEHYLGELQRDKSKQPRLDFMVVYATHYNYYYPPRFAVHKPAMKESYNIFNGSPGHMKSKAKQLKNRFLNAVLYTDSLLAKLFQGLRAMGRLDNTIVVVTGDHGEEFWEHGRFGHIFGMTNEQTRVPMILHFPSKVAPTRYTYANHADVMPTLFDFMRVNMKGEDWMAGKSLLRYRQALDFTVTAPGISGNEKNHHYAVLGEGYKVYFNNFGPMGFTRVTDHDDNKVKRPPLSLLRRLLIRAKRSKSLPPRTLHRLGAVDAARYRGLLTQPRDNLVKKLLARERWLRQLASPPPTVWNPHKPGDLLPRNKLVRLPWREVLDLRAAVSKPRRTFEFLPGGQIARGSDPEWHHWRMVGGQLFVFSRSDALTATFRYDRKKDRLVGRDTHYKIYQLAPSKAAVSLALHPSLWPAHWKHTPITRKMLTKQRWKYHWISPSLRFRATRMIGFKANGRIGRGRSKAWHNWLLHQGRLYLFNGRGDYVAVFFYNEREQRLLGKTTVNFYLLLNTLRLRAPSEVAPKFWDTGSKDGPLDRKTLLSQPWRYRWYNVAHRVAGSRLIEFKRNGRIGKGRSYNWSRWKLWKGRLYLYNRSSRPVARFLFDPKKRRLVALAYDGYTYVLQANRATP